ncbi:uncharacterized protein [Antennarius striatus]|uniref:uncharacterized protein n=1 Tax=Antennarius striatus TaxID=241820 RepID=UPI0035ADFB41
MQRLNAEVRALLKARDAAFRAGEAGALRAARRALDKGIKEAKSTYAQKIQGYWPPGDPWRPQHPPKHQTNTPPPEDTPLSVTTEDVRRTLQRINPRKAAGPDGVPGRVLKDCSHQLAEVLTDIFNTSVQLATVPSCLKSAAIVPVPKRHSVTELNDYRPLALKFTDDTVVVGRIQNDDESRYREEVEHLVHWCRHNNLCINVGKTKEMVVDFRRKRHSPPPLHIGGAAVEVVSSHRYLGVQLTEDLTWSCNTSYLLRKAHQRLYFLRKLRGSCLEGFLQGSGGEHPHHQHHCVARQLLCSRQESSAEGGEGCTEDCRGWPTYHHRNLHK